MAIDFLSHDDPGKKALDDAVARVIETTEGVIRAGQATDAEAATRKVAAIVEDAVRKGADRSLVLTAIIRAQNEVIRAAGTRQEDARLVKAREIATWRLSIADMLNEGLEAAGE